MRLWAGYQTFNVWRLGDDYPNHSTRHWTSAFYIPRRPKSFIFRFFKTKSLSCDKTLNSWFSNKTRVYISFSREFEIQMQCYIKLHRKQKIASGFYLQEVCLGLERGSAVEHFLEHTRLWIWSSALEEKKRKPNRNSFDCSDLQTFSTEVLPGNALFHEKLLRVLHTSDFLTFSFILPILSSLLFSTYWVWASLGTTNQK